EAGIEAGPYDPTLRETDTLELAHDAQRRLGEDRVRVSGEGAPLTTDVESVSRGVSALIRAALRHGGLDEVDVVVRGAAIDVTPVTESSSRGGLGHGLGCLGGH